jgi:AhpD family alkylhydroperoxidase
VSSSNGIRSESRAGRHGTASDRPGTCGPDLSTVAAGVCVPRRFASAEEAARDLANVVLRGRLLAHAYAGGLDSELRERVMVAVSQVNACGGCTRVHRRWALRAGVSSTELEALRAGDLEQLDARSRAAVHYAVERAEYRFEGSASAGIEESAREHLSVRELEEIDAIARAMALANLSLNTLAARKVRLFGAAT